MTMKSKRHSGRIPTASTRQIVRQAYKTLEIFNEKTPWEKVYQVLREENESKDIDSPWIPPDLKFYVCSAECVGRDVREWVMALFRKNVGHFYEERAEFSPQSGEGLNLEETYKQLFDPLSIFIFIQDENTKDGIAEMCGYTTIRFEVEDVPKEDGKGERKAAIMYCYELEIDSRYQGKGLGNALMDILQYISKSFSLERIMLTTFKQNQRANRFYSKLGFIPDEDTPTLENHGIDVDYTILYKRCT